MEQDAGCGFVQDSCGVYFNCGNCTGGMVCDGTTHTCVPPAPPSDAGCTPVSLSCSSSSGQLCGTISDGCGNTKQCNCPTGQLCGGGGVPGICGVATECTPGTCGSFSNACGSANINCGGCATGMNCTNHMCVACMPSNPNPCAGRMCGSASNGCTDVSCGGDTCGDGGVCDNGECCTPTTCEQINDAGCTPIPNGCGGQLVCVQCGASDRCVAGTCTVCPACDGGTCDQNANCCYPQTCSDFPNAGCQPQALGCGKSQVCNPCQTNQVCLGDGTCCTPSGCAGRIGVVDNGCGQQIDCPPPR